MICDICKKDASDDTFILPKPIRICDGEYPKDREEHWKIIIKPTEVHLCDKHKRLIASMFNVM